MSLNIDSLKCMHCEKLELLLIQKLNLLLHLVKTFGLGFNPPVLCEDV